MCEEALDCLTYFTGGYTLPVVKVQEKLLVSVLPTLSLARW